MWADRSPSRPNRAEAVLQRISAEGPLARIGLPGRRRLVGWSDAQSVLKVALLVVDRRVLHLIRVWLDCPVEEAGPRGVKTRATEARDQRRGIPQGSPISPLLANIYMRRFVLGWKKLGLDQRLGAHIVSYADDLVIVCRRGNAEEALRHLRDIMGRLKLTANEEKTRVCTVSWSPETGQVAKVGSTERKDGPDDGQAEAVFG